MAAPENPSKGFLERWSRKKIEGAREAPDAPAELRTTETSRPDEPGVAAPATEQSIKAQANVASIPEFDLASLPSLDSITAATDIRAFLSPGVPKELARAALRRAWAADPAIRDFKGLAENDWDFTDPAAMPGFGALPEGYDVKKLLAQIFSDGEKPADAHTVADELSDPQAPHIAKEIAPPVSSDEAQGLAGHDPDSGPPNISASEQQVAQGDIVHRNNIGATHKSISSEEPEQNMHRRSHGGALPQ